MAPEVEQRLLRYVQYYFGWFGGMGDCPDGVTLLAVISTVLELGPDLKHPETKDDANQLLRRVRELGSRGFGSHAGISDLSDDAFLAVIRGTAEFMEHQAQLGDNVRSERLQP